MKIDVRQITPFQKLTIEKGLCDYQYIMNHWQDNDLDFQKVYYNFYLRSRWAVMSKAENKSVYFAKLQSVSKESDIISIIDDLKKELTSGTTEFSIVSKLIHTKNDKSPIYDKKIREYLSENEGQNFYWQQKGAPRGMSDKEKIKHDWELLVKWYNDFLETERCEQWIKWFDSNFPNYIDISNVKKVDSIIFSTN